MMNENQVKMAVRWFVNGIGASLIGFAVGRGWVTPELGQFFTSETFIGIAGSVAMLIWGFITHTNANTTVAAAKIKGVDELEISDLALAKEVKEKTGSVDVQIVTK